MKSKLEARAAALRDIVAEIGLEGHPSDHLKIVRVKGLPHWAIVLRNNWGRPNATGKQIEHAKRILGIDRDPAWCPLYRKDYFV